MVALHFGGIKLQLRSRTHVHIVVCVMYLESGPMALSERIQLERNAEAIQSKGVLGPKYTKNNYKYMNSLLK